MYASKPQTPRCGQLRHPLPSERSAEYTPQLFRSLAFSLSVQHLQEVFTKPSLLHNACIAPQRLREWFCSEMASLRVNDRYIDAFCGRVPKSVLARHYTDYSPEKLKEIYDKAGLKFLD